MTAEAVHMASLRHPVQFLDVRKPSEFNAQHVEGAINIPLETLPELAKLPDEKEIYYVYCEGGYRSVIFVSLMEKRGARNLVNITGGIKAMKAGGQATLTKHVCPANGLGCG